LRLHKANPGWAGGLSGASKVEKQFNELSGQLAGWFRGKGILPGVQKK